MEPGDSRLCVFTMNEGRAVVFKNEDRGRVALLLDGIERTRGIFLVYGVPRLPRLDVRLRSDPVEVCEGIAIEARHKRGRAGKLAVTYYLSGNYFARPLGREELETYFPSRAS